jgi:hypothetical protein
MSKKLKRSELVEITKNDSQYKTFVADAEHAVKVVQECLDAAIELGVSKSKLNSVDIGKAVGEYLTDSTYQDAPPNLVAQLKGKGAAFDLYERKANAVAQLGNKLNYVKVTKGVCKIDPTREAQALESATIYAPRDGYHHQALMAAQDVLNSLRKYQEACGNAGIQRILPPNLMGLGFIKMNNQSDATLKDAEVMRGKFTPDVRKYGRFTPID